MYKYLNNAVIGYDTVHFVICRRIAYRSEVEALVVHRNGKCFVWAGFLYEFLFH
jgi:hypothetical protein